MNRSEDGFCECEAILVEPWRSLAKACACRLTVSEAISHVGPSPPSPPSLLLTQKLQQLQPRCIPCGNVFARVPQSTDPQTSHVRLLSWPSLGRLFCTGYLTHITQGPIYVVGGPPQNRGTDSTLGVCSEEQGTEFSFPGVDPCKDFITRKVNHDSACRRRRTPRTPVHAVV